MSDHVVDTLVTERPRHHGDFTNVSRTSQDLMAVLRQGKNWDKLTNVQKESLTLIMHKVGRIMSGDPNHADHWDDIGGYARLASDRLKR